MASMNGKERIAAALARRQPDTVPIWELAFNEPSIIGIARHFMDEKSCPNSDSPRHDRRGEAQNPPGHGRLRPGARPRRRHRHVPAAPTTAGPGPHARRLWRHRPPLPLGEPHPVKGPINQPTTCAAIGCASPPMVISSCSTCSRPSCPAARWPSISRARSAWPGDCADPWKAAHGLHPRPRSGPRLLRLTTDYVLAAVDRAFDQGADWLLLDGDLAFNAGP